MGLITMKRYEPNTTTTVPKGTSTATSQCGSYSALNVRKKSKAMLMKHAWVRDLKGGVTVRYGGANTKTQSTHARRHRSNEADWTCVLFYIIINNE